MAQKTTIEWTDVSWNPVHGCSKVSPGCAHCYAETLSRRYGQTLKPWTPANAVQNVTLKPHKLREPLSKAKPWDKPCRVFVNSMSDLFHELIPFDYVRQVFAVMEQAPQHTFQILTKRPVRMRMFVNTYYGYGDDRRAPLPNVWLGTSIENRRFLHRADELRNCQAAVRFISAEPLLGPLDGINLIGIDWLIVGGESGPGHRRIDAEWVRTLRDACLDTRIGDERPDTAFFFKQWGGARPKSNGRTLDGRTWDQMPDEVNV